MSHPPTLCCTTHPLPTSVINSHLLTSFLQALSAILRRQASLITPANASHPIPLTNSSLRSSSSTYHTARSQPLPESIASTLNNEISANFQLPSFPSSKPLPRKIIELEIVEDVERHTRHFSHQYFVELQGSWHEKQMFPEENFAEVEWERVEERWRRGQGYREGKRGEKGSWVGGRVTERARREEVGELGKQRAGWRCKVHGCGYWIREVRWGYEGEDEDAEE